MGFKRNNMILEMKINEYFVNYKSSIRKNNLWINRWN